MTQHAKFAGSSIQEATEGEEATSGDPRSRVPSSEGTVLKGSLSGVQKQKALIVNVSVNGFPGEIV